MNYKTMLAKILSGKELADVDIKKIKEDDVLLEDLIFCAFCTWYFDKHLELLGLRIVLLDMGNDTYYVLAASTNGC